MKQAPLPHESQLPDDVQQTRCRKKLYPCAWDPFRLEPTFWHNQKMWPFWDIKISKPSYESFLKMVELCHFCNFYICQKEITIHFTVLLDHPVGPQCIGFGNTRIISLFEIWFQIKIWQYRYTDNINPDYGTSIPQFHLTHQCPPLIYFWASISSNQQRSAPISSNKHPIRDQCGQLCRLLLSLPLLVLFSF